MAIRGTLGAVGLLLVAGMLATERPLDAGALGGLNSVTVSPTHGKVASSFQVTYAISPCQSAAGLTIGFSWGGLTPAGQRLGTATTDGTCRATLSTKPPVSAATHQLPAAGSYQVFGYVALPTGAPTPNTEASASYRVDVTPAPSASSSATSQASASAPGPAASGPAASGQPATAATESGGKLLVFRPGEEPFGWTLSWTVGRRALIVALTILAALALLAAWIFRRRRARAAAALSKDKAA